MALKRNPCLFSWSSNFYEGKGKFFQRLKTWRAKEEQQKQASSFDPVSVPKTRGHKKKNEAER